MQRQLGQLIAAEFRYGDNRFPDLPVGRKAGAIEVVARVVEIVDVRVGAEVVRLVVVRRQTQQRFVFVNSRKYREGDALQEGPVVEQITATGAVLSYRGARFKLTND